MGGFDAERLSNFAIDAVAGFARDQVVQMIPDALAGFRVDHVRNLDKQTVEGIQDAVATFVAFDVEVRKELVQDAARRLGGVGSFTDLLNQLAQDPTAAPIGGDLPGLGWEFAAGPVTLALGSEPIIVEEKFGEPALVKALKAFAF